MFGACQCGGGFRRRFPVGPGGPGPAHVLGMGPASVRPALGASAGRRKVCAPKTARAPEEIARGGRPWRMKSIFFGGKARGPETRLARTTTPILPFWPILNRPRPALTFFALSAPYGPVLPALFTSDNIHYVPEGLVFY